MSRQAISCAVLLLVALLPCSAADKPRTTPPPHGYHDIKVGRSVIRVKDEPKPTDTSHNIDLGKTSAFSNKTFDTNFASLSKNDSAAEESSNKRFSTHSFSTSNYNQSDQKYQTVAYKESARHSDDFSKSYDLPAANSNANRTFDTKTSDFQGKKAQIAQTTAKVDPFAAPSSLNEKTFFDPALKHVKRDPYATGMDVERLANLPNRPLTIDEVRNLINHEQIPDLNSKPDAPTKPLNDPNWEPPTVAPMAHEPDGRRAHWSIPASHVDSVPIAPPADMDGPNDLPSPGEMAHPENSEPLPK